MAELKLWYNDSDYVIAESPEDAWAVLEATMGVKPSDFSPGCAPEWEERTKPLSILIDETGSLTDSGNSITKTPAEWVAEKGRGWLCTTEY